MIFAEVSGATLPGSDSAQIALRPICAAAAKSTPAAEAFGAFLQRAPYRMIGRHTKQTAQEGIDLERGQVRWTFCPEGETLETLLRQLLQALIEERGDV